MRTRKVGEYYFRAFMRGFKIYVCTYSDGRRSEGHEADSKIYDFETAKRIVYEKNGWKIKG